MRPHDVDRVLAVGASAGAPGKTRELTDQLRRGLVVMVSDGPLGVEGYVAYRIMPRHVEIASVCVHPAMRRRGVGRSLLDAIHGRLPLARRRWASLWVDEKKRGVHLWLSACGFEAVASSAGRYRFARWVK